VSASSPPRWPGEERLWRVVQVARELAAGLDLTGVLRRALALSTRAVGAVDGFLYLLDDRGALTTMVMLADGKFLRVDMDMAHRVLSAGLEGWVARTRQPALVNDVASDPRWMRMDDPAVLPPAGAAICVPLLHASRLVGVLTCTHRQAGGFDDDDLETLQWIADQVATAVENAWLFALEEQRRALTATLGEIARTLAATLDLDQVLRLILDQLQRVVPGDSAAIFLLEGQRLVIRAWRGFANEEAIRNLSFPLGSGQIMARVVSSREPLVCADVQQEAGWENVPGAPPIHGWIGAPLVARGEVVGALTVDSAAVGAYGEADARTVAAFADHAAIAVANARLWREVQRRLAEVAFLHKTGQALAASLELEDVLRSLMQSVRTHFRAEAASVALVDEATGELVFRVASGAAAEEMIGVRLRPSQGIAGWVVQTGQPTVVASTATDGRWYPGVDQQTGFHTRAIVAVPIRLGERTIGVVEAVNPQQGDLEESDLDLLLNVATLAASAIQNAHHFTLARDAEQRYASLFENSADPIIITDDTGVITDVNRKLCTMLGYEKAQVIGRPITTLWSDDQQEDNWLSQALRGEGGTRNVWAMASDGATVPFEVQTTRIVLGTRPCIQWICHDLTERLELERVRQDLTNLIIHDLRNPVATIVNSAELIQSVVMDKAPDLPVEPLFDIIQRSSERLQLLIDSILDLARMSSGQVALEVETFNVVHLVEETVRQVQPMATARQQRLESILPDGVLTMDGDWNLLQRALINLIDNAIKFTPLGGEIRVEVQPLDLQTILFAVADNGPGIPPEHQQRIFEQFSRLHRREVRGTGLGLALCKLAVEAHGGRIWVESEPGRGATFKFTLPVRQENRPGREGST